MFTGMENNRRAGSGRVHIITVCFSTTARARGNPRTDSALPGPGAVTGHRSPSNAFKLASTLPSPTIILLYRIRPMTPTESTDIELKHQQLFSNGNPNSSSISHLSFSKRSNFVLSHGQKKTSVQLLTSHKDLISYVYLSIAFLNDNSTISV